MVSIRKIISEDPRPVHHPPDEVPQGHQDSKTNPDKLNSVPKSFNLNCKTATTTLQFEEYQLNYAHKDVGEGPPGEVEPVNPKSSKEEGKEIPA